MNAKELYIELQKSVYDDRPYHRMKDWGEGMEIVEEVISGYWRERFLINHDTKEAYELMNRGLTLTFLNKEDVDWEGVKTLENNRNAYTFSAYYQRFAVETFKNGVALVEWTLYPEGRYFMDEDGFGMEDNDEVSALRIHRQESPSCSSFPSKRLERIGEATHGGRRKGKIHQTPFTTMNFRKITFILLFISVLSAFADKKMTIRNEETGESFEVSVPDGLKIYEYNSNWLDSIPYLLERARHGEPWAYEALGDCYRYGNGGIERSIFKTWIFYTLSGMDVDKKMEELVAETPDDNISLIYRLVGCLLQKDNGTPLCILDTLSRQDYRDADVIRNFLGDTDKENLALVVEQSLHNPEVGTDKMIFALLGCLSMNWFPDYLESKEEIFVSAAEKFPYLYDKIAVKYFSEGHEDMDSVEVAEKTVKAIGFLEKADKEAMLSRKGAAILYNYYAAEVEAGRKDQDAEEMERLAILAGLPESETFIFTDK